ncbi:RNA polymerase sigma factor [Rubrolithibacter danxiaensis]|uniref:RNA polymerase sigma factor n=1 Tax=Rubrolithibacter danxiaensis TaxID=3390805 RepID=UPI003BF884C2
MPEVKVHTLNDAWLLQQMECGDKQAFNLLYEKYWERTYSDAYKRLKDYDAAKDIVQEVFTHIWLKKDSTHIENLPAYLNIAVRNKVFKVLDKQKLKHPFFEILENMPSTYLQADADVLWKEFFKSYEALLNSLPEKRQVIFRLRFQENLSTKDIALQLGLSRKTVQNQLGKAIEQLRISLFHLLTLLIALIV